MTETLQRLQEAVSALQLQGASKAYRNCYYAALADVLALIDAEMLGAGTGQGEREQRLANGLRLALKRYQRELPCSCHSCRKDAGATDGVGTNGRCHHSTIRSLVVALGSTPLEKHDG